MTIDDCLDIAYSWNMDILSFRTTAGRDRLRAAILALLDAEAEACAGIVMAEQATPHGLAYCEAAIRARIAARSSAQPLR